MDHVGASLKRKLGPLPVWGWALITGVVLYVVRNRSSSGGGGVLGGLLGGGTSTGDGSGSSTGTLSDGAAAGGGGDFSGLEAQIAGLEKKLAADEGLIAKLRKKLRNKPKPKPGKGHKPKGHKPPHKPHKPHHVKPPPTHQKAVDRKKDHVPGRKGIGSRRDKTHIALKHQGEPVKSRAHVGRILVKGPADPSHRDAGRKGDTQTGSSFGARTHFGGYGSPGERHRPESPPTPGRNNRPKTGPVPAGQHEHRERVDAPPPARSSSRTPAPRHQAPAHPKGRNR